MKITLTPTAKGISPSGIECTHPVVSIELPSDDLSIYEFWNHLFKPSLLAIGFNKETIDQLDVREQPLIPNKL